MYLEHLLHIPDAFSLAAISQLLSCRCGYDDFFGTLAHKPAKFPVPLQICCLGAVWVSCSVAKATASDFPFPVLLCFPKQSPSCGDCLLQALLFFCGVRCRHPRVLQTLARLTQPKRRSRQRQLTIRPSKSWWKCLLPWAVPSMPCCSTAGAGSWPGGCQLAKQH